MGAAESVRQVLLAEQVARQPMLAVINSAVAVLTALSFLPLVEGAVAGCWLLVVLVVQALRCIWWWRRYGAGRQSSGTDSARFLLVNSAAAGVLWGLAGVLFRVDSAHPVAMLLPFVLGGMTAGAVMSLPGHLPSFYAFYLPALLPYGLLLALEPSPTARTMAILVLLFALGVGALGWHMSGFFRRTVALSLANLGLVEELQAARANLEREVAARTAELRRTNERLETEVAQRRASEAKARHLLHHDPLSGLPNRTLFHDRLDRALALAARQRQQVGVMLVDIDDFKAINDGHGHPVGDRVLRLIGARLSAAVRASDTVARLGGDEFAVIQQGLVDRAGAEVLADKLLAAAVGTLAVDNTEIAISACIGVALYPDHGAGADALLSHADMALYAAKRRRGCWRLFSAEMAEQARSRRRLEGELRHAIGAGELRLHYQPRFALRSGAMTGVEALVRWQHPEQGLLGPGTFIPVAESTGLIRPLGRWVLEAACRQAAHWIAQGRALRVAVNLSPAQFREQSVPTEVARALDANGLAADALELEITETLYLEYASDAVYSALHELREMGVRLAIDDFGTGYSSLAYLRNLPFDSIKIDRAFVGRLGEDHEDEAIVNAVVTLIHRVGKRVVAEGVETERQLEVLRELGCDEAQGFLLARPMPPEDI